MVYDVEDKWRNNKYQMVYWIKGYSALRITFGEGIINHNQKWVWLRFWNLVVKNNCSTENVQGASIHVFNFFKESWIIGLKK